MELTLVKVASMENPVDNLKAEGPSLSLYSLDTHNESKKVVSIQILMDSNDQVTVQYANNLPSRNKK
ncbi:hypothetical protein NC653_032090 [Populus alba x Populus x berolinensis]|uniref:Uncharacterized protein n=1 Tax=Populus alba x Populus x berolinensis TaxID=444605 RepID=A0AAD6LQQ5_9ROSI|nr:hypothetical protein NC653_032090 [Populus alba x Populus x berolinensis]